MRESNARTSAIGIPTENPTCLIKAARVMRTRSELPLADGSRFPVTQWSPNSSGQPADASARRKVPLLLVSNDGNAGMWDAFAEYAAQNWSITHCRSPSANQLLQVIWSIGEPAVVCANGADAGTVALHAQAIAQGAIPLTVLIDFRLSADEMPTDVRSGRVAIVRGRQSEVASHAAAVHARALIGGRCELVELENCGDNAAASCPAEFESAVSWLMFGE